MHHAAKAMRGAFRLPAAGTLASFPLAIAFLIISRQIIRLHASPAGGPQALCGVRSPSGYPCPSTSAPFVSIRNTPASHPVPSSLPVTFLCAEAPCAPPWSRCTRSSAAGPASFLLGDLRLTRDASTKHQAASVSLPSFAQCHEHAACRISFPSLVTRGASIGAGKLAAQRRQALPVAPWCHG
jgi:hypothetical protein